MGIPTAARVLPSSSSRCGRKGPWGTEGSGPRNTSVQALSWPLMIVLTCPVCCHPFTSTRNTTQLHA